MTGRTHDLAAFTALVVVVTSLPQLPSMNLATAVIAFGANFIGGLFPDIDQPTSDFWDNFRLGPFIAKVVCPALGGHRHISHSLVGLVIIGTLSDLVLNLLAAIVTLDLNTDIIWCAFMIGVLSHLITDGITRDGLPLLWPLRWKFGFPPLRRLRMTAGGFWENFVIFPALLLLTGYQLFMHQAKVLEFLHQYVR